ncbi:MAG: tRNA (adenosine(37)-N6)-threonylcarbamoyltransferase complex dimerization subunit type 1 TsaB [Deferribacterales bacterium]
MIRIMIDTSLKSLSVTLSKDKRVISHISVMAENKISEKLFYLIDETFKNSFITKKEIDEMYVITGPGSFTGLRIGISSAYGLSTALNKPLYGLTTNDAFAISQNLKQIKTAVKLRGKEYAYKEYDFTLMKFSEFQEYEFKNLPEDTYIIEKIDTEKVIINEKLDIFRSNPDPFYFKKPEAEVQLDKKSLCK